MPAKGTMPLRASFAALRREHSMNIRQIYPPRPLSPEVEVDVRRILDLWAEARARYGGTGDFLFGEFGAADIMFAPVVTRFATYSIPLPRFAALRSDEVNLRTGPGVRYPIDWVYKRRDLPVQIEREFEVWRLIRDQDGVKGWVHQATLTGRRSFMVTGTERVMHRQASPDASPVARLQPGVLGHIRSCEATAQWCQVQVGEYKGWLKRDEFWGILPNEAIN